MSDTPQVNDDPRVPPDVITPSLQQLMKGCFECITNMEPRDTPSFITGFYIGVYRGMNKPIHPYVVLNIECGRFDRLIEEANL